MYDQLRAMGVFSCVVEQGSFSGAAKVLGITTSAVSQQIRTLEQALQVVLLRRSTRRISLTEEGQVFFQSCKEMLAAADRAKNHLLELKDNLTGSLKILTTPELATNYVIPALSDWMAAHQKLDIIIETQSNLNDLPNNHDIDLVIKVDNYNIKNTIETIYLASLHQVVVASPIYLNKKIKVQQPNDLLEYKLINMKSIPQCEYINMKKNNEDITIHMPVRLSSHDVSVVKTLCKNSFGVARILSINVQEELLKGELVQLLPDWKMASLSLYACPQQQNWKANKELQRCLNILTHYFQQIFAL